MYIYNISMSEINKYQVLSELSKNIKQPNMNKIYSMIFDAVKNNTPEILDYANIVKYKPNKKGEALYDKQQFDKVLELIYAYWWDYYLCKKYHTFSEYNKIILKDNFTDNPKRNLYSKQRYKIEYLVKSVDPDDSILINFPITFQSVYFCQFFISSYNNLKDLINFNTYSIKLYLETSIKDMPELLKEFSKYMVRNDLTFPFKCALTKRNDSFVVYVNFDNLKNAIEMIEFVKNKKPELFKNCKVSNPLLASYKGYIGLGEEPYSFNSYNNLRSALMLKTFKVVMKNYKTDESYLTIDNIKKHFKEVCEQKRIDPNNFYLNKNPFQENDELSMKLWYWQ